VAKSKKARNIYNKAQFESRKHLQQTTSETLKVAPIGEKLPNLVTLICCYSKLFVEFHSMRRRKTNF
jgi:hypothetical protein